jgi:hypothetical protein
VEIQVPAHCHWMTVFVAVVFSAAAAQAEVARDPAVSSADSAGRSVSIRSAEVIPPGVPRSGDWSDPVLLASYPAFDNWSLDTAGGRDSQNLLQFAVRRWEYSDQNWNYDRYALDHTGEVVGTWLNVPGLGKAAAFTDAAGRNFALRPVATTQYFAVVDSADYIHLFSTQSAGGWEVSYSKVDPDGNTVIPWDIITQDADPWNFYVQPIVFSDDTVAVVWMRDTDDVCAVKSADHGVTWSEIIVLIERDDSVQGSCVKAVVGDDDSMHLVWRTLDWSTYVENLWYAKLYPDWSVCVDETPFYEGSCWYPYLSIDNRSSLHVTFGPIYDVGMTLTYTRLRGDLDLGGEPATDEMLTEIPEEVFVSDTVPVRYPANVPDSAGNLHVIYERGEYGRETDKDVYYIRLPSDCPADFDGDGDVDTADLLYLLGAWGTPDGDVDGDGDTDTADLLALLAAWGECP